jgi:hypothetical protein
MSLERLEDLSVYYLVKNLFASVPGVLVVDDYPNQDLVLPTVAVTAGKVRLEDFELGNRAGRRYWKWRIDVYAKNKSQRDEFGYRILDSFLNGVTVYDYNAGFPPATVSGIGHLDVVAREMDFIRVMPELVDKMYYRAAITIVATNDTV